MRKILPLLLLLLSATTLFAQDAEHRTGLTFSAGFGANDIAVRRMIGSEWAALGTLGYQRSNSFVTTTSSGPVDVDFWTLTAGARRYFAQKPLRPFAEANLGLRLMEFPGCGHLRNPYASAGGGVEYSIAPRVSIEGSAGLAYSDFNQRCTANDGTVFRTDQHSLSTFRTSLSVTFYF